MSSRNQSLLPRLLQTILIATVFAVTAVVFEPLHKELSSRMEALKAQAIETLESRLGRSVAYDTISPSILTRLEIRGLTVFDTTASHPLLVVDSVLIRYRILPILFGNISEALVEIRVRNTEIEIDTERDSELIALFRDIAAPSHETERASGETEQAWSDTVVFSGRNIRIRVRDPDASVEINRLRFTAEQVGAELVVDARFDASASSAWLEEFGYVETHVRTEARIGPDLGYATASLDIRSLTSDLFVLTRQQFRLQSDDTRLEIRKVEDSSPVDLVLSVENGGIDFRFIAQEYRLSDLVTLRGAWGELNPWLTSTLSGTAAVQVEAASPAGRPAAVHYTADIEAAAPQDAFGGALTFALRMRGDRSTATIPTFRVVSPWGPANFSGDIDLNTLLPRGALYIDVAGINNAPRLTASLEISRSGAASVIRSRQIDYAGVRFSDVEARLTRSDNRLLYDFSSFVAGEGTLRSWGGVDLSDVSLYNAHMSVTNLPIREVYNDVRNADAQLDLPDNELISDSVRLGASLDVSGSTRGPDRTSRAPHLAVELRFTDLDTVSNEASLRASGGLGGVRGDGLLEWGAIAGSVSFDGAPRGDGARGDGAVEANVDLTVNGVAYSLSALYNHRSSVVVREAGGGELSVLFGRSEFLIRGRTEDLPLPATPYTVEGSRLNADLVAEVASADSWKATVNTFSLSGVLLPWGDTADLALGGRLNPGGAVIDTVEFSDSYGRLEGAGTITYDAAPTPSGTANFLLDGDGAPGERYELQVSASAEGISSRIRLRSAPVERSQIDGLSGLLDAEVTFSGSFENPEIEASLTLIDAVYDGESIDLSAEARFSERRLSVSRLQADYIGLLLRGGGAQFDFESGAVDIAFDLTALVGSDAVETSVALSGTVDVDSVETAASLPNADFDVRAVVDGIPAEAQIPSRWELVAERRDGRISIVGGPEESVAIVVDTDGAFFMSLTSPLPITVEADGVFSAGDVELNLTRLQLDAASIPDVLDFGNIAIVAGHASGNLRMTGPITDPEFYGTVPVRDFEMRIAQLPDTIGPTDGFLVFSEKEMRIHPTSAPVGQAEGRVSGFFLISRWDIEQLELDIETTSTTGVRFVEDFDSIQVDGFARGRFRFLDDGADTRMTGNLVAHNATITLSDGATPIDDRPEDREPLTVDLQIQAGRGVEFLWPTTALPILRAVIAPGDGIRVRADTLSGALELTGDVSTQGGELFYLDRTFLIREGLIRFNETEANVDPLLSLRAETRDIGPDGPVRISLIAEESPLSRLSVRAVSDPPLSDSELLAILGGGVFATGEALVNISGAVLAGSDIVSQFGVIRTVESNIRNALQLDLFSVRTQLFQNLVRGVIDEPTDDTSDAPMPSLGRYLNNTTLFLGRALGPDVFAELLVQLRARDPFGAGEGRAFAGIDIDSEFSLEFETPFFDLQWSFFPRNPRALFVPDNQFTFSWGFTY